MRAGSVFLAPGFLLLGTMLLLVGCGGKSAAPLGGPPVVRQLTPEQYNQSITDIFGADIKFVEGPAPITREAGLLAVGLSNASIAPRGLELYAANARGIAAQVTDGRHRASIIGCPETAAERADKACLERFIAAAGRLLYRRPLTPEELQLQFALADAAVKTLGDRYAGVEASLASMLAAPQFLFRWETAEINPQRRGTLRLDAFSKASRLSFLLWNTTPDDELLAAAESGSLDTKKGWRRQVERMLASPRLVSGVRAFFADMLAFDRFSRLSKDQMLFPNYATTVADDAPEQTLLTITDLLLTNNGDYRDLFTTRTTFLTRHLGAIYALPVTSPREWERYEFAEGEPRAAGILTHFSFVGLHSHPGRSSPTLRGKALREILLCQKVPDPPGNVDFSNFETSSSSINTARERLAAHASVPACAGCHKITDPIGLTLEQLDSAGGFREKESGAPIDTSGELDGKSFNSVPGLGRALHDNPAATGCLVNRVYAYAVGRQPTAPEAEWLRSDLEADFAKENYRFRSLLRKIALSSAFTSVTAPQSQPHPAAMQSSNAKGGQE